MVPRLARGAVWLAVLLLIGAGSAMADTANLSFVDGGTVSGTFVYDVTTGTVVSWNFVSTEFGGTTFDSSTANGQCFGVPCGGQKISNQNGDTVFGFDAFQPNGNGGGTTDELDIVISCGGVVNCVQNVLSQLGNNVGNSFAITAGPPTCPNPNSAATGTCIPSGEQQNIFNCLGAGCTSFLGANNFLTITDPPSPTDVLVNLTLSNTLVGNLVGGGGENPPPPVPEPSTVLLLGAGLGVAVILKVRSA